MKYLETKHEKKSAIITTIIAVILVLLCFVVGQDYQDPPEEYGVAINFGDASIINNNLKQDTSKSIEETELESKEPEEIVEEEIVEEEIAEEEVAKETVEEIAEEIAKEEKAAEEALAQEKAEAEAAEAAAEKLLAQQEEEALKIKNEKEDKEAKEIKEKLEKQQKEAKEAKERAEKAAAAKKAAEAKAKADNAVKAAKAKAQQAAAAKAAKAASDKAAADKAAKAAAAAAAAKKNQGDSKPVSFALIENSPIYPGCESGNNTARKKCMNDKIKQFLNENFNKILASDLGLNGVQKINIRFTINKTGRIVGIKAKAANAKLEDEAKRVVKLIPKMKPGMQQGRATSVSFNLPLSIKIN